MYASRIMDCSRPLLQQIFGQGPRRDEIWKQTRDRGTTSTESNPGNESI